MQCATHPDVETELRCGKCDTPICPRCLVQTPVGARCKSCANLRRPPMYDVSAPIMARAVGVSLAVGAAAGALWGFLLPNSFGIGIFGIFIALFIGSPIGYGFANLLDKVTNRKRGPVMQGIAIAGIVAAWLVHVAVGAEIRGDIFGLALVAAACAGAISRLR